MLAFECDYNQGCHERVLQRFMETNLEKLPGYGEDKYCMSAKEKIKAACECPEAEVYLLTGGTQTNQIVIDTMLADYEGVIAADTGHVNVHEAGAIEKTGHKVLSLPEHDGKLDAKELAEYLAEFAADGDKEHMVFPGMVYISHPTEYGTLYTKQELAQIAEVCAQYEIKLFLDGARLGYGLCTPGTDVTLPVLAEYCDVFYIGGTKVGALCGEALVFPKHNMPKHFTAQVKQHGALLAKGRLVGISFDTLFTDNLYFEVSRHAMEMAEKLKGILTKYFEFYLDSPTNQQFVLVENEFLKKLQEQVRVSVNRRYDEKRMVVRFTTSWGTTAEELEELDKVLEALSR
ncbi:MAG: aminotransferase class I/II-fold pyridoxal phosphate-dependent enzyme [Lachnospiraceae bacterium]|nr:aminotransferase class I/II-fold pyridoxal phosphate-dependent enzyme [Lachnospiraceae bacterium]